MLEELKIRPTSFLRRGLLTLSILTALGLASALPSIAQDTPEPARVPANPAFISFLQGKAFSQEESVTGTAGHNTGLVPEPFILPQRKAVSPDLMRALGASMVVRLPSSYDLRTLNRLTPVRDQGECGDCWAFAAIGSLESSLMPAECLHFSENNMKNTSGFDLGCCGGGNVLMAIAYLARWGGATNESDDPYDPNSCTSPTGLTPIEHVQNVNFLPSRTGPLDNNALKQAVMTCGAVFSWMYLDPNYYRAATAAYYYQSSNPPTNHAVCVVGWDDNFSATNFQTTPPGNGAFLIRNSYGTGFAYYFWISYYDSVIGVYDNGVFTAEPVTNYSRVYQYDTYGWVTCIGFSSPTGWFANVFTATTNSTVAAASWYTALGGSSYVLEVYTQPSSRSPINSSGPAAVKIGTIDTAGYHTIKLDSPVPITAGQRFSVVVKLTTPGFDHPIPIEMRVPGYDNSATASAGQGYVSNYGTSWADLASYPAGDSYTHVCLKAFTTGAGLNKSKSYSVGAWVELQGVVTAVFSDGSYYVEAPDRSCGTRVSGSPQPNVGDVVQISGTLSINNAEVQLDVSTRVTLGQGSVNPIGVAARALGGGPLGLQPGITGASGANNIGILVRVWGNVTEIGSGSLYIDDGSNWAGGNRGGDPAHVGVIVVCDPSGYNIGDLLSATGISSCYTSSGGQVFPHILTRGTSDIRRY